MDFKPYYQLWHQIAKQHDFHNGCIEFVVNSSFEKEGFSLSLRGGRFCLESGTPLGFYQGIFHIKRVLLSKQTGRSIGIFRSEVPLRVLGLQGRHRVLFHEKIVIDLPDGWSSGFKGEKEAREFFSRICLRVIEMGYNALFFETYLLEESVDKQFDLGMLFQVCEELGLELILRVSSLECISKVSCHRIFWRQTHYCNQELKEDQIYVDLFFSYIRSWEQECTFYDKKLIVSIPWQEQQPSLSYCSSWFCDLVDFVGPQTAIAFSYFEKTPASFESREHSLWQFLLQSLDYGQTPLMPVLDLAYQSCGEGLWGISLYSHILKLSSQMSHYPFLGPLILSSRVPQSGSLLDGMLSMSGLGSWKSYGDPLTVFHSWLLSYRPTESFFEVTKFLQNAESVLIELKTWDTDMKRGLLTKDQALMVAHDILGRLRVIQEFIVHQGVSHHLEAIESYQKIFTIDLKRMFYHMMQAYKLVIPSILENKDLENTFWTSLLNLSSQQINSGVKVEIKTIPSYTNEDTTLKKLFFENTVSI